MIGHAIFHHRALQFLLFCLCLPLAACSGRDATRPAQEAAPAPNPRPAIQEQSISLRAPDSPYRTVVPGDTLYSIAWESGRDYRELAGWNRIPAPYTIKPGQQLRVTPPSVAEPATDGKGDAGRTDAVKREARAPAKAAAGAPGKKAAGIVAAPATTAQATPPKGSTNVTSDKKKSSTGAKSTDHPKKTKSTVKQKGGTADASGAAGGWAWPTDGKVLNRYSESESKGLDINGVRGESVRAAASGRVVYQGSGLRGYGQLIIIKHSDEFLSAYAHNDRIHVKEGEAVKRGQKIADMGSTGTDQVKLHFEIRRHGAPVDPLKYLPKR